MTMSPKVSAGLISCRKKHTESQNEFSEKVNVTDTDNNRTIPSLPTTDHMQQNRMTKLPLDHPTSNKHVML